MTAPELKEVAKQIPGLTGVHAMKKADLLDIINKYYGIEEEVPAAKKKKKAEKRTLSVKELKAKIIQLREKKEEARATKDKKNIEILRRRINRLKKQTRKVAQG
ncbi:MAG: transcription termination factor Rho [Deltaproteobacteria bacterium]|uniref:Transcription termination factor Rho n=1 Tax=Candidatus Desulfacyla euxinica TaxID=2841693 RepID=A0A8J6MZH4_9DELT|nr:transcription termination factor Rho [Candidatus Desulfacyla euxinica]MBL7217765.1 transcription termination factor Rho [Desulfobacteraceae bacterium]